jgi:hypothetical protein
MPRPAWIRQFTLLAAAVAGLALAGGVASVLVQAPADPPGPQGPRPVLPRERIPDTVRERAVPALVRPDGPRATEAAAQ